MAPELAGAFLNLEPLVGTAAGALAFGDPFGTGQLLGALAILVGIALSTGAGSRTDGCGNPHQRTQGVPLKAARPRWEIAAMHTGLHQLHFASASHAQRLRRQARAERHVSARPHGPLLDMTLFAPRPDRTTAPRVYATPVVRELPCAPAATGASSAW